jgi:hypothetical protein
MPSIYIKAFKMKKLYHSNTKEHSVKSELMFHDFMLISHLKT